MSTVLVGLLSFMCEDKPTSGSIRTTTSQKRILAKRSWGYNLKSKQFCKLFPEWTKVAKEKMSVQDDSTVDMMIMEKSHHSHNNVYIFLGVLFLSLVLMIFINQ